MKRAIISTLFIMAALAGWLSCQKEVKENAPAAVTSQPEKKEDLLAMKEPPPDAEKKIKLKAEFNFNGKWRKTSTGSKAIIVIKDKAGKVIGNNGGEIPIKIVYMDERTVKIFETDYNPKYLSNWLPESIANMIYLNELLKHTYSVLRIVDQDTLVGMAHSWQVLHSGGVVQSIEPLVAAEEWKRITE